MTAGKMFELIGNVDEEMIADAAGESLRVRRSAWIRRGAAAACICLLAGGALALAIREQRGYAMMSGGGGTSGLTLPAGPQVPEGVDPKIASIAIYPDTEKVQDVLDAEIRSLTEAEALAVEGLSDRLPSSLPEGYFFCRASLYVTTMKSGQVYHLLRVFYGTGEVEESVPQDTDTATPPGLYTADVFTISVLDCKPRTDKQIYEYMPVTEDMHYSDKTMVYPRARNGTFILRCDDVYVTISPEGLEQEEVNLVVDAVTEGLVPVLAPSGGGGMAAPGGAWPEGVDPITASIAVYPATENVQDVADAALRTITEEEALQFGELGRYLPHTLPEGWWFVSSEVYETTMKDGSEYHLLRATYSRSDPADFDPEKPYLTDDCFMLQVLDYLPETKTMKIYTPEKLMLSQRDRDDFYLALDNVYIGIFPQGSIEVEELLQLIGESLVQ